MEKTEITIQVYNSLEQIKNKLVKNGFNLSKTYILTDWYFSKYPLSTLKNFSYKKLISSSFLVRDVEKNGEHTYLLQYKIKNLNKKGEVLSEEKITSTLSDLSSIQIFKNSSLINWCKLVNYSYIFGNSSVEFAIQDCGKLGIFIEIEEPENGAFNNLSAEEKVASLKSIAEKLGLDLGVDVFCKKPYLYLHKNI